MSRFLVRRIGFGLIVLWVVLTIVFVMYFVAPHDPARLLAGRQATALTIADVRHRLGTDRPILEQYGSYLGCLRPERSGLRSPNSRAGRCSTCPARTTPVRRDPKESANAASSTATGSAAR